MNNDENSSLSLTELLEQFNNRPKLIKISDTVLYAYIDFLISDNANQLRGEHSFYCVYQKPLGSTVRYALIHATYLEKNGIKLEDMDRIILEDGKLMQQKLEEAQLECDYFYIMPYFDFVDRTKGSILLNNRILETNDLKEFENQLIKEGK